MVAVPLAAILAVVAPGLAAVALPVTAILAPLSAVLAPLAAVMVAAMVVVGEGRATAPSASTEATAPAITRLMRMSDLCMDGW